MTKTQLILLLTLSPLSAVAMFNVATGSTPFLDGITAHTHHVSKTIPNISSTMSAEPVPNRVMSTRRMSANAMPSDAALLKNVRLMAREEAFAPIGTPQSPNRNRAFASVFVDIQNPYSSDITLVIQSIQIRDAANHQLQMEQTEPQEIHLRPLENTVSDFQLARQSEFARSHSSVRPLLKAVVTYRFEDQVRVVESEAVAVN